MSDFEPIQRVLEGEREAVILKERCWRKGEIKGVKSYKRLCSILLRRTGQ